MPAPPSFANLLLTHDRRQRIRLAQAGLAGVLMCACLAVMHVGARYGIVEPGPLREWTVASLAGVVLVLLLIRSGMNRYLSDPALTVPQMMYAIFCSAWGYTFSGAAHGMVPGIVSVVLMFGMFGLSVRQVAWIGAYTLALFGAAILWMAQHDPLHYPIVVESLFFGVMGVMVCGVVLLTLRLNHMRDRLRHQKVELEAALAHIHRLATHDELTGLFNRRHMQELLEAERLRCERSAESWCVALLDLDHFKQINDRYGHAVGDEVLRGLARQATAQVRRTDVLARWGGEEFVLLLPNTPRAAALTSLERLRLHFEAVATVVNGHEILVSFSAGLTEYRRGETVSETLERADKLCYSAKTLGRNRIESD